MYIFCLCIVFMEELIVVVVVVLSCNSMSLRCARVPYPSPLSSCGRHRIWFVELIINNNRYKRKQGTRVLLLWGRGGKEQGCGSTNKSNDIYNPPWSLDAVWDWAWRGDVGVLDGERAHGATQLTSAMYITHSSLSSTHA